jgi:hypothetical protein
MLVATRTEASLHRLQITDDLDAAETGLARALAEAGPRLLELMI